MDLYVLNDSEQDLIIFRKCLFVSDANFVSALSQELMFEVAIFIKNFTLMSPHPQNLTFYDA